MGTRFTTFFDRQAMWALAMVFGVLLIAGAINLIGIRVVGDVRDWSHWLNDHRPYFLVWRTVLYCATACGWYWMRRRVLHREPGPETLRRLLRAEIAAATVVLLLEGLPLLESR